MFSLYLKNIDRFLIVSMFSLLAIGLISLWSLSIGDYTLFYKQLLWVALGFAFFGVVSMFDYRIFKNYGGMILGLYFISILALFLLVVFGIKTRGVAGWFRWESFAVQPVEFMKIILIVLFAKYFSKRHVEIYQIRHIIISGLYVLLPTALVMLQPDLGSAMILIILWITITLFSGIKIKHFLSILVIFSLVGILGWTTLLKPYQKERVVSFINPYDDPMGSGYNIIQSLIAVGSGGAWGKGIGQGPQSHLLFLPEAETDFIFAAFAEEWGFLGNFLLISLFLILLLRMLKIGSKAENNFAKLFILGFATLIFSQLLIHIGVNTGLLPVTGITLPFVSYGGSSLITLMIGMGIVQSIKIYSRKEV